MVLDFLFDFGSPNAYLSHLLLPDIEKRQGVRFAYVPILLGGVFKLTGNRSPFEVYKDVESKRRFQVVETGRFLRRHGLEGRFRRNPHFPVNTLQLMRGAHAARAEGVFEAYVDAVYRAMWEKPRKMDDPAVFREALVEAGLDADRLIARAAEDEIKGELISATGAAVERGVFGSPTFFVGDEMFFGKDQLREVEEEIELNRSA